MTATTEVVNPLLILEGEVRSVQRISPSFVRIAFGGKGFEEIGPEGPTLDQRIKVVIPNPGRPLPLARVSPDNWYTDYLALPEEDRGNVRTYTARAVTGEGAERQLVVDFVLHTDEHGESGPAARFAEHARVGDLVGLMAPRRGHERDYGGIEYRPGAARRLVFAADETALPALASILESLPADANGWAVVEVPEAGDFQDLAVPAGVTVEWIARGDQTRGAATVEAVRRHWGLDADTVGSALQEPDTTPEEEVWETTIYSSSGAEVVADRAEAPEVGPDETYAWIAGDSDTVKVIRRLLVGEVGMARHNVAFMGYWKVGMAQL